MLWALRDVNTESDDSKTDLILLPHQSLEMELRNLQSHNLQSEGYLVQLDDRLSSLSTSAYRNLSGLGAEVSRTSTWLRDQDILLR